MVLNLEEFQRPQFQGYIENIPLQRDYILRSFLPQQPTDDIQFSYNVINGEYATSASITGWNASAPLRDNKDFATAFSEVAKVQHGVRLDEKQLLAFNRPRSDDERNRAIEYVYTTADELSMGVDDIEEYLRAQALYNGVLDYHDYKNDIHLNIDFGIPSENKLTTTTDWSDFENSTPLTDIENAISVYQSQNLRRKPVVMHMTTATRSNLLQNAQIKRQIFGDNATSRLITIDDINNVFNSLGFPPIQINDDVIVLDGEGEVPLLEDNKVVFLGQDLGNTMIGPTVENNYRPGKFVQPEIFTNPPGQGIIVGEAVFPALERPKAIVILDV